MKKHNFIGKVTIEEKVNAVHSEKNSRALIIDVPSPLVSYYSRFTDIKKPNSIILVTRNSNSFENILRTTKTINSRYDLNLEGAKCEVKVAGKQFNGIRLKGVHRYTSIDEIMHHYQEEGFDFNTNKKIKKEELALIRVNKFFDVEEVNDIVLRSVSNKDEFYFKLNKPLKWDEFKEKTRSVKYNIGTRGFDIAQGILYNKGEINDIVRIVKPALSLDLVEEIEKAYNR